MKWKEVNQETKLNKTHYFILFDGEDRICYLVLYCTKEEKFKMVNFDSGESYKILWRTEESIKNLCNGFRFIYYCKVPTYPIPKRFKYNYNHGSSCPDNCECRKHPASFMPGKLIKGMPPSSEFFIESWCDTGECKCKKCIR